MVATGCSGGGPVLPAKADQSPVFYGAWQDRPAALPDVTLTDTGGQKFNLRKSPSRPVTLVYFAYLGCPDLCTDSLTELATALRDLSPGVRDDVGVLVVDIAPDPAPAHQAELRSWLKEFDPGFVGLTGPVDEIHDLARELGVEIHTDADGVLAHSDQVIAFRRGHSGALLWTSDVPVDQVTADLATLVAVPR